MESHSFLLGGLCKMIRYVLIFEEDDKYKTHKDVKCVFHIIYGKYTDRHKVNTL